MGISTAETKPELTKYELGDQIGHGGMATVYRARDRRLGRDVAVKLIHPHLRGSAEVAARFVSEARAVAMLKHENIVEVYDISDETEAERYLVVELVSGPTLRRLLTDRGALPAEVAAAIALQVAAALGHAHEQNIIHRDVKPENVLIAPPRAGASARGERARTVVKLTDFGIAKLLDAHGITSTGQVLGSPAHMAPEQIEGGDVGPRADVFGLGVLLFECMVGRLPFDGNNPAQVLRRVLEGEHPSADRERPEVGQLWSRILDRALMKDQQDRFDSIEAFAAAIRDELARLEIDDPGEELDRFIEDPEAYRSAYTERIVERLVRAGERARQRGDVIVASAEFNRALSLRPGDRDLVNRASALARRTRMQRVARVGGIVVVAGGALGATAFALAGKSPDEDAPSKDALVATSVRPRPTSSTRTAPAPPATPSPSASAASDRTEAPQAQRPPRPRGQAAVRPLLIEGKRMVKVNVEGPKGGVVLIDGQAKPDWWERDRVYELDAGDHTFGFSFKDPNCCRADSVTKTVEAGEGVFVVLLTTSFKDAALQVSGPAGKLTCSSLLPAPVNVPSRTSIRVSSLEGVKNQKCTYDPEDPNSPRNVPVSVTLEPGQTTNVDVLVP